MTGTLLITGASGYVGSRLAERYLDTTDGRLVLWSHASGTAQAEARRTTLEAKFAPHLDRITFAFGDLASETPLAGIDPAAITQIVHGAAVTRFNVEEHVARTVNTEGSEKIFDFAARCPRLDHLAYLGTIYSTGLRGGRITEDIPAEPPAFANHYEASKHRAERLLWERYDHLPYSILRLATVIADDDAGNVVQINAVHNTLRLLRYGLLPLVPGEPRTPLYFVTGDFVARSILEILDQDSRHEAWHLCHGRDGAPSVQEILDIAFDTFEEDEDFRARRLLRPLYADYTTFESLVGGLDGMANAVTVQALRSVAPFARQLYIAKDVDNTRLRALNGAEGPDMTALLAMTCRSLVQIGWKRHP